MTMGLQKNYPPSLQVRAHISLTTTESDDDDIDLASPKLEETLADKPLPKKRKVTAMIPMDDAGSEQEDEGKSFELASWV